MWLQDLKAVMRSSAKAITACCLFFTMWINCLVAGAGPISFEPPAFVPLDLINSHALEGWQDYSNSASITPSGQGYSGGQALKIPRNESEEPFLRKAVTWNPAETVAFIDFRIKPAADPAGSMANFYANGSQLAFQLPGGSSDGQLWAYHGSDGYVAGSGQPERWYQLAANYSFLAGQTTSSTWLRVTLRQDYGRNLWDVFVEGKLVAVNLAFDQRGSVLDALEFYGSKEGDALLDDVDVETTNMLFDDPDKDGLPTAWEVANGSNPNVYDRDAIKPGTGKSFVDVYLSQVTSGSATAVNVNTGSITTNGIPPLTILRSHQMIGALKGSMAVGDDGTSNYSIPIEIPKGTGGMEPKLSLNYSSAGSNGLLGLGWGIGGLQHISRGPTSFYKDGYVDGVDFDANDRFFLDGQRLVCVEGTYGQAGSVYRTEIDSYSRITALGTGSSVDSWRIETKAGLILTLGGDSLSKVTVPGKGALSWSVSRVEDTVGNYYTVENTDDNAEGSVNPDFPNELRNRRVSKIRYTGYSGTGGSARAPYAEIVFGYETRLDKRVSYMAGLRQTTDKRLKTVTVDTGGFENHHYELKYDASEQTGRSLLVSVQKVVPYSPTAIPATTFEWKSVRHADPHWVEATHLDVKEYGTTLESTFDMSGSLNNPAGQINALELTGNVSRGIPLEYSVTANTRLEFEFKGDPSPNWAMIGLDEDTATSGPSRLFRVVSLAGAGPPLVSYVDNAFKYTAADGTWQKLTIPVGSYYTGLMKRLVVINNDNNLNDGAGKSCYRNIKVYEAPADPATAPVRQFNLGVSIPEMVDATGFDRGVRFQDFTGDGYADLAFQVIRDRSNPAVGGEIIPDLYGQCSVGGPSGFQTVASPPAGKNLVTGIRQGYGGKPWVTRTNLISQVVDINADGIQDFAFNRDIREVSAVVNSNEHGFLTWSNGGWVDQTAWKLPFRSQDNINFERFAHFEFADLDGDGFPDLTAHVGHGSLLDINTGAVIASPAAADKQGVVYLNKIGSGGGWLYAPAYELPLPLKILGGSNGGEAGRALIDVNGDGLPDFMENRSLISKKLWINTGSGWDQRTASDPLNLPVELVNTEGGDVGTRTLDLNGDGLVDVIKDLSFAGVDFETEVYLGTGTGWEEVANGPKKPKFNPDPWDLDVNFVTFDKYNDAHPGTSSLVDINADGLPDLAVARHNSTGDVNMVYFNTGYGWWKSNSSTFWAEPTKATNPVNFQFPDLVYPTVAAVTNGHADGMFVDVNGDGVADMISDMSQPQPRIWINQCGPELIKAAVDGLGTRVEVDYVRLNDPAPLPHSSSPVYQGHSGPLPAGQVASISNGLVVSYLRQADGRGGWIASRHHYGDLRHDRTNEASLGFAWTEIYNELLPADGSYFLRGYTHTENVQQYPLAGPSLSQTYINVGSASTALPGVGVGMHLVAEEVSTYDQLASTTGVGGVIRRPVQTQATNRKWELNGVKISEVVSTQPLANFDEYGFVKFSSVVALDGTTTETSSSFAHTVTGGANPKWLLGRLLSSTVVNKASPGGSAVTTKTSAFTYDPATGLLKSETVQPGDPLSTQTVYTYDGFGNKVGITTTASGQTRSTSSYYGLDGRFLLWEDSGLGHTSYAYSNARALILSVTDPDGLETSFDYDAYGTKLATHLPDGTASAQITLKASNADLPSQVAGELATTGQTICWAAKSEVTGAPVSAVYYDFLGHEVVKETMAMTGYSGSGSPLFTAQYSLTIFDTRGRTVKTSSPFFLADPIYWTVFQYDPVDRVQDTLFPDAHHEETVLTEGVANGSSPYVHTKVRKYTLGKPGERIFERRTDQFARLLWTTDGTGQATVFSHDIEGNVTEASIDGVLQFRNRYDIYGRRTGSWDVSSGTPAPAGAWEVAGCATTIFNGFGEPVSVRNPQGQITTSTYDSLGRVTQQAKPEGTFIHTYRLASPAIGKLQGVTSAGYSESVAYDSLGRVVSKSTTQFGGTSTISSSYNALGLISSETDAGGVQVVHDYDPVYGSFKLRTRLFSTNTTLWEFGSIYATTTNGEPRIKSSESLAHGIIRSVEKDATNGRIRNISSTMLNFPATGQSKALQNLDYTWDENGNLLSRTDVLSGKSESFEYDTDHVAAGRLSSSTVAGQSAISYLYDLKGNLTSKGGESRTYNDASRPFAVKQAIVKGTSRTYSYDSSGRVTSDGKRSYTWTSFDQLATVTQVSAPALENLLQTGLYGAQIPGISPQVVYGVSNATATFEFDAVGGRSRQTLVRTFSNGSEAKCVTDYLGSYEVETNSTKAVIGGTSTITKVLERHTLGSALYTREVTSASTVERLAVILTDHVGSTDVIIRADRNGSAWKIASGEPQAERQGYSAWGERREGTTMASFRATDSSSYRKSAADYDRGFTGHEMLDDFGLVHMNGRIYDPELGRFLSSDPNVQAPEFSQNFNRYSYVLNNPLSYVDPTGNSIADIVYGPGASKVFRKYPVVASVVNAVIAFVVSIYTSPAVGGAVGGALNSVAAGGDFGDVLKGAAVGYVQGYVTNGLLKGYEPPLEGAGSVGAALSSPSVTTIGEAAVNVGVHVALHGVVGGAANAALGGRFQDGFISAAVGAGVGDLGLSQHLGLGDSGDFWDSHREFPDYAKMVGRTTLAGIAGGTATAVGGGKFGNGFYTAAFQHLFNAESQKKITPPKPVTLTADEIASARTMFEKYPQVLEKLATTHLGSEVLRFLVDNKDRWTLVAIAPGAQSNVTKSGKTVMMYLRTDAPPEILVHESQHLIEAMTGNNDFFAKTSFIPYDDIARETQGADMASEFRAVRLQNLYRWERNQTWKPLPYYSDGQKYYLPAHTPLLAIPAYRQ